MNGLKREGAARQAPSSGASASGADIPACVGLAACARRQHQRPSLALHVIAVRQSEAAGMIRRDTCAVRQNQLPAVADDALGGRSRSLLDRLGPGGDTTGGQNGNQAGGNRDPDHESIFAAPEGSVQPCLRICNEPTVQAARGIGSGSKGGRRRLPIRCRLQQRIDTSHPKGRPAI